MADTERTIFMNKTKFFVRLLCWILAALMLIGTLTYIIAFL